MSSFKASPLPLVMLLFALLAAAMPGPGGQVKAFQEETAFQGETVFHIETAFQQETPPAPEAQAISITSPAGGEALQGVVTVRGTTQVEGFQSMEVTFAFQSDTTDTWFLIEQRDEAVVDGDLASWDTTTITDGVYRLRVRVLLAEGQALEQVMDGLRVRNYSAVETSTPTPLPTPGVDTPTPGPTQPPPTATPAMYRPAAQTPNPLPMNPAQLTGQDLRTSAAGGIAVVLGTLLLAGIYLGVRSISRR